MSKHRDFKFGILLNVASPRLRTNCSWKERGYVTWTILNVGHIHISVMDEAWVVKFLHRQTISSLGKRMINHTQKGRGKAHAAHVCIRNCGLLPQHAVKWGQLLELFTYSSHSDSINSGHLLLATAIVYSNNAIQYPVRQKLHQFDLLCICSKPACIMCWLHKSTKWSFSLTVHVYLNNLQLSVCVAICCQYWPRLLPGDYTLHTLQDDKFCMRQHCSVHWR